MSDTDDTDATDATDATDERTDSPPRKPRSRAGRYRAGLLIGVLVAGLGFAIAVQVHANSSTDNLKNLRPDDLIDILDNQDARADSLRQQISELQQTLLRLQNSGDRAAAARQQAQQEAQALGILIGTVPATGPGVRVTIGDPGAKLGPEDLLDVIEELRGAGAEVIQFGSVRVSTSTALTGAPGAVQADGVALAAPYTVLAIGEPTKLDTALNIPGGVAATLRTAGATFAVDELQNLDITALRTLANPRYATPAPH